MLILLWVMLINEWVDQPVPITSAVFVFHEHSHQCRPPPTAVTVITNIIMPSFKPFVQLKRSHFFFFLSKYDSSLPCSQFFHSIYPIALQHSCLFMDTSVIVWTTYWPLVTSSFMKVIYSDLIILMFRSPPCTPWESGRARLCGNKRFPNVSGSTLESFLVLFKDPNLVGLLQLVTVSWGTGPL